MPWMRIEPHRRTADVKSGLAAEIADPLWVLLRQWQFGELTSDDGGSPIAIDISASWSRFSKYRAEGGPSTNPQESEAITFDPDGMPLEACVEHEPVIRLDEPERTPWTVSVRAGRMLADRLHAIGRHDTASALAQHAATTFVPQTKDEVAVANRAEGINETRYRALLGGGRVIDGIKVLQLRKLDALPPELGLEDLDELVKVWATDVDEEWGVTDATPASPAWIPDRFEYSFALAAPPLPDGDGAEIVLRAKQYDGTGTRWSSLDLAKGDSLGADADADGRVGQRTTTVLPSPLTYPGMAANRFWEMEDASVALGTASHGRTDLARILATEFAVIYSPDWYMAPVEVPVGSVARIDWVIVRDTFGIVTLVGDAEKQAKDNAGRQFQPSIVDGKGDEDQPLLVVLPSVMGTLSSQPLEEVSLQRDEMANLCWGRRAGRCRVRGSRSRSHRPRLFPPTSTS
jgi:hypothetical protein